MLRQTRSVKPRPAARALAALLLATFFAAPMAAQVFHEIYGKTYEFGELTSVSSGFTPGVTASANFRGQGLLLKVLPTGKLAWVKAYGPTMLSAARELPGGVGFAWIGTGERPDGMGFAPVVARVDAGGTVVWSKMLNLPLATGTGDQVYGRFLEIDPRDGGFWVGGELWQSAFDDSLPWLGKLDAAGNLLWAKLVRLPQSARFHALFPALSRGNLPGGVVAVGEIQVVEDGGDPQSWMLALALSADGNLLWADRYQVLNSDRSRSQQLLADLDRDPRFELPQDVVVGTVTGFCKDVPSAPCNHRLDSAAFTATLDETNGNLTQPQGLFSRNQPKTYGETIVMDLPGEITAVGGEIEGTETGSRKGFLALLNSGSGLPRNAMTYGVGAGFDGNLRSLDRWRDAIDRGYLFLLDESYAFPRLVPTDLRNLVKTDKNGVSGACECPTEVEVFQSFLRQVPLQPDLLPGLADPFPLKAEDADLVQEPCQLTCSTPPTARRAWLNAHPTAPRSQHAPLLPGILPGIPGPLGTRRGMPLLTLPLRAGAHLRGLAGGRGERLTFRLDVPEGTRDLTLRTAAGTGDVDLLVSRTLPAGKGERASRGKTNRETVRLHHPAAGTWYVTLEGKAAFSGVTLSVEGGGR